MQKINLLDMGGVEENDRTIWITKQTFTYDALSGISSGVSSVIDFFNPSEKLKVIKIIILR